MLLYYPPGPEAARARGPARPAATRPGRRTTVHTHVIIYHYMIHYRFSWCAPTWDVASGLASGILPDASGIPCFFEVLNIDFDSATTNQDTKVFWHPSHTQSGVTRTLLYDTARDFGFTHQLFGAQHVAFWIEKPLHPATHVQCI